MSDQEKNVRKSLKTLQSTAHNADTLVGRPLTNLKQHILTPSNIEVSDNESPQQLNLKETGKVVAARNRSSESPPLETEVKKHVSIQVEFANKITVDDLTNPKEASDNYWKTLAIKQQNLIETLMEEKHKMKKRVEELQHELTLYKQMLEEANSFVDVIKEMTNDENDDTGIDLSVSTLDGEDGEDSEPK